MDCIKNGSKDIAKYLKQEFKKLKIPCEIYTRVCGFYRPVSQMNKGKQEEVKERKTYKLGFENRKFI